MDRRKEWGVASCTQGKGRGARFHHFFGGHRRELFCSFVPPGETTNKYVFSAKLIWRTVVAKDWVVLHRGVRQRERRILSLEAPETNCPTVKLAQRTRPFRASR